MTATVRVRLFAVLRERAGRGSFTIELPEGATVSDALAALAREPGLGELMGRMSLGTAVNREYVPVEAPLRTGDELALIPPLSGGAQAQLTRTSVRITCDPLSIDVLTRAVGDPSAGAIVTFSGTTRTVPRLEYEAYVEMAKRQIESILHECAARHGLLAAAAEHRTGGVPLGEASVIVAVSAPHRAEAFAGAREAIDRIKAEAPIWKREVLDGDRAMDGQTERWVQGTPAPEAR